MKEFFTRTTSILQKRKIAVASIAVVILLIFSLIVVIVSHNNRQSDENTAKQPEESESNNFQDNEQDMAENNNSKDESFAFPISGVRPYAVMIDNEGTKCLPQGGLHKAQVIYEIIVEGGETRFMPVFWASLPSEDSKESKVTQQETQGTKETNGTQEAKDIQNIQNARFPELELIGPVRSSRHYFLDYVLELDAIYVHFGWSPRAMSDIPKLKINNINGVANGGEIFWDLTKDRNNWQDSYTSMQKINEYVKKVKYRTETDKKSVFSYNKEDVEIPGGVDAKSVLIKYNQANTSQYLYNAETREYSRLRKGKPHMERATEEQLKTKNIIIQFTKNYTIKGDTEDRQEVETTGNGEGWYITCGKAVKVKWTKKSRNEATEYKYESGEPVLLNPGQTWVQIVPIYGNVEIKGEL
ncbi:MAG TPA: DUF3048 domain-containing protein [Clostridiales bacterium]|nr:DUF3048 domain-containing protein [Clostridiales bacterium]